MFKGIIRKVAEEYAYDIGLNGNILEFGVIREIDGCNSIDDVISKFASMFEKKIEEVEIFEDRIIIERVENGAADPATEDDIGNWEEGLATLWDAEYFLEVFEVVEIGSEKLKNAFDNLKGN